GRAAMDGRPGEVGATSEAWRALDVAVLHELVLAQGLSVSEQAIRDVARAGDRMPQKSTYFYPKLITGLLINPLW
ncbi:MAG TPA: hypothetical protein VIC27_07490, partial [Ktedonobacterales bacterium]